MGRKRKPVLDENGEELFRNLDGTIIRVQEDKTNQTYILWRGSDKVASNRYKRKIIKAYQKLIDETLEKNKSNLIHFDIERQKQEINIIPLHVKKDWRKIKKIIEANEAQIRKDHNVEDIDFSTEKILLRIKNHNHGAYKPLILQNNCYLIYNNLTEEEALQLFESRKSDYATFEDNNRLKRFSVDQNRLARQDYFISDEEIINAFLVLLKKDKYKVARLSGIEEFTYLEDIKAPVKIKLSEMLKPYLEKEDKPLSKKTKIDAKNWWKEFCKVVQKQYINDIEKSDVKKYKDYLTSKMRKNKYGNVWYNKRFTQVKTIIKYTLDETNEGYMNRKKLEEILIGYFKKLFKPINRNLNGIPKSEATPISIENYHKILRHCIERNDLQWTAMLLLSLNCAMYPKDIQDLLKVDIDLEKRVLKMIREKTGVIKFAYLWQETCDALKVYWEENNKHSKYAIISNFGTNYKAQSIRNKMAAIVKRLGIDKSVKYEHLRDTTSTICAEMGISDIQIKALLGHQVATGQTKNYIAKRPKEMTEKAVKVIYDHYKIPKIINSQ